MFIKHKNSGQAAIEYMLLLAVVVAIVLVLFKREFWERVPEYSNMYFNNVAIGILGQAARCGDGNCTVGENCSTCPVDCLASCASLPPPPPRQSCPEACARIDLQAVCTYAPDNYCGGTIMNGECSGTGGVCCCAQPCAPGMTYSTYCGNGATIACCNAVYCIPPCPSGYNCVATNPLNPECGHLGWTDTKCSCN